MMKNVIFDRKGTLDDTLVSLYTLYLDDSKWGGNPNIWYEANLLLKSLLKIL